MFKQAKLGTKFRNKKTGEVFQLRRFVNPQTLKGTLYLYDKNKSVTIRQTTPKQWEQV